MPALCQSFDRGETWSKIPGTERALYITGFFFQPNSDVIVSTYGRGLFRLSWAVGCTIPLLQRFHNRLKLDLADEVIQKELAARDIVPEEDKRMPDGFDDPKLARISLSTDLPMLGIPTVGEVRFDRAIGQGIRSGWPSRRSVARCGADRRQQSEGRRGRND